MIAFFVIARTTQLEVALSRVQGQEMEQNQSAWLAEEEGIVLRFARLPAAGGLRYGLPFGSGSHGKGARRN